VVAPTLDVRGQSLSLTWIHGIMACVLPSPKSVVFKPRT
jgi:hypothetical protein